MEYLVSEDGHLVKRTCCQMPEVKGKGSVAENKHRRKRNKETKKYFEDLVQSGQAIKAPRSIPIDLEDRDLVDGAMVIDPVKQRKNIDGRTVAARRQVPYETLVEGLNLICNWLATENEFQIPKELKSFVMAWQGRKPKKQD